MKDAGPQTYPQERPSVGAGQARLSEPSRAHRPSRILAALGNLGQRNPFHKDGGALMPNTRKSSTYKGNVNTDAPARDQNERATASDLYINTDPERVSLIPRGQGSAQR